jgi:dihydrofolate synthase/folylpolyglutamate synthase
MNAALAIAMLRHQSAIEVPESAIRAAMGWADWPARLQKLSEGPLTRLVPGVPVWIDGCHNPASAQIVAEQLGELLGRETSLHIITGILANKDAAGILGPFSDPHAIFHTVPIPGHPHHEPQALADWLGTTGRHAEPSDSVPNAMRAIACETTGNSAILILGSLYLAGTVLKENGQIPD